MGRLKGELQGRAAAALCVDGAAAGEGSARFGAGGCATAPRGRAALRRACATEGGSTVGVRTSRISAFSTQPE
eukprot:5549173-Prymnesium_polylepis.1